MSKVGQWVHTQQDATADARAIFFDWAGQPLEEVDERALRQLVWVARLYLRNDYCTTLFDDPQTPLMPDVKAEVMRRAREAEQSHDRKEMQK